MNLFEQFESKNENALKESLNKIDLKCIDENKQFLNVKCLYEANQDRLSARDKADLKKLVSNEDDPNTIVAFINSKVNESQLKEDFEDEVLPGYKFRNAGADWTVIATKGEHCLVYSKDRHYTPAVVVWGLDTSDNTWGQGRYFETVDEAMKYLMKCRGVLNKLSEACHKRIKKSSRIVNEAYEVSKEDIVENLTHLQEMIREALDLAYKISASDNDNNYDIAYKLDTCVIDDLENMIKPVGDSCFSIEEIKQSLISNDT